MEYCEKNKYVLEVLLANPHKFGERDKAPLREHVKECKECQASVDKFRKFAKMMNRKFEY
jgi:IS1 family transposase